jgi:predicted nucleic acid-binding protein
VFLKEVFNIVSIVDISGYENEVFEFAVKEELTIYDAAYLYYAIRNELILVTDDRKLREKAKQYVGTVTTRELTQK